MDPLSITVSTVALVELGLKLLKGLEILKDLSHVPDEIEALIDELQDFHDVLAAVCVATKQRAKVGGLREGMDELKTVLGKARDILTSIADHCGITFSDRHHNPGEDDGDLSSASPNLDLLTRFRWLKDRKRIKNYRRRMKVIRLDIGNHLASLSLWVRSSHRSTIANINTSFDSCSVLVELRSLAATFRKASTDQPIVVTAGTQAGALMPNHGMSHQAGSNGFSPSLPEYSPAPLASTMFSPDPISKPANLVASHSSCSCRCHRTSNFRTPNVTDTLIGSWKVELKGVSKLNSACDELACKKSMQSSFKLSYRFPSWLSNLALSTMVYSNYASGPQMSLTCSRIICRNSDIFCFAMQGDIAGIQDLFHKRLASPFDATSNYGYTALHYATDYGHYDLCAFLMKAGARGDLEDFDRRTSSDIAYKKMCAPTFDASSAMCLKSLFNEEAWLEEKQFTILHKIILGLTNTKRSLTDELLVSTKEINTPDAEGRTPISWAAEHNDQNAVSTLLGYGADSDKADGDGNTPLHYACSSEGRPTVLSMLLQAGALPTPRNKWQQSPLNWASFYQNDPEFVRLLLAYPGVDLHEMDQNGATAIGNAAFRSNERMLLYLLDAGADPNITAVNGTTPLLDCISGNDRASTAILLQKSRECGLNVAYKDAKGETCLHYLARRANVKTVSTFLEAVQNGDVDLAGLHPGHVGKDGLTVRDLLTLRGNEEVMKVTLRILEIIESETASEKSSELSDEIRFLDAFEYLPQLEKGTGIKVPVITTREIRVA